MVFFWSLYGQTFISGEIGVSILKTTNDHQQFEYYETKVLKDITHAILMGFSIQHYLQKKWLINYSLNLNRTSYSGISEFGSVIFDGPGKIHLIPTYTLSHKLGIGFNLSSNFIFTIGGQYTKNGRVTYEQNRSPAWGGVLNVYHELQDKNVYGVNSGITYIYNKFQFSLEYFHDFEREIVHDLQFDALKYLTFKIGYRFKLLNGLYRNNEQDKCPKL